MGQKPSELKGADYTSGGAKAVEIKPVREVKAQKQELVGVDVFVSRADCSPKELAEVLKAHETDLALTMISNRGTTVWPNGQPETYLVNHWRCRFKSESPVSNKHIVELLSALEAANINFIKTEHLYNFDGDAGYSKGQGEK